MIRGVCSYRAERYFGEKHLSFCVVEAHKFQSEKTNRGQGFYKKLTYRLQTGRQQSIAL